MVCSRGVTGRAAPEEVDFFWRRLKTSVSTWSSAEQQLVLTIASGREGGMEGGGECRGGESNRGLRIKCRWQVCRDGGRCEEMEVGVRRWR